MQHLILILAFVIAFPFMGYAQRKRALMVGISNYKTNGFKVWTNIHGAEDVALLKPELEKKGFKVQTLTNEHATYKGIVKALNAFITTSQKRVCRLSALLLSRATGRRWVERQG